MRTTADIIARMKTHGNDFFGKYVSVLADFISPEDAAASGLFTDIKPDEWVWSEPTRENVLKAARDYMGFAIGKAQDKRGLSAPRSIIAYQAYAWLLDDPAAEATIREDYDHYGMPDLLAFCKYAGWDDFVAQIGNPYIGNTED